MAKAVDAGAPAGSDKKKLVVAGGVVGALVLGASGYLLLGGGGSDDDLALGVPPVRPAAAAPAVKAPVKAKPAAKPQVPAVATVKLGRDPFLALYTQPVAAPAAPTTPTTVTGTGTGTGSTPTTPTEAAPKPYSLSLVSIAGTGTDGRLFTFKVAGVSKTVVAAQKFGQYGELVVLTYVKNAKGVATSALVQVGDDDPVKIDIGERISVL